MSLECAAAQECSLSRQRPLTRLLSHHPAPPVARSLAFNDIGADGGKAVAAVLKDTQITTLRHAPRTHLKFPLSTPADTHLHSHWHLHSHSFAFAFAFAFTSSTSSLLHVPTCVSKRAHLLPCSLSEPSSLLPAPLPHSHPRDAALDRAPRGLRPLPPAVRVDHACSRIPTSPPCDLPITQREVQRPR